MYTHQLFRLFTGAESVLSLSVVAWFDTLKSAEPEHTRQGGGSLVNLFKRGSEKRRGKDMVPQLHKFYKLCVYND